jgi:hypothetical protein
MPRYMLLKYYAPAQACDVPMSEWSPQDIQAHIAFQRTLTQELLDKGELVDAQGLAAPDHAKVVVSDGKSSPVVTDGPFPESKELLAGYLVVDTESPQRALEIAAKASASPGPGGVAIGERIEVREVMSAPTGDL